MEEVTRHLTLALLFLLFVSLLLFLDLRVLSARQIKLLGHLENILVIRVH